MLSTDVVDERTHTVTEKDKKTGDVVEDVVTGCLFFCHVVCPIVRIPSIMSWSKHRKKERNVF